MTAAVDEFVTFFRDFLQLCLSSDWPESENGVEEEEVTRALQVAQHVEQCVNKMKSDRYTFNRILELLCVDRNFTITSLHNCMNDPTKYVLKKIINSEAPVRFVDIAFQRFKELYSEDRLVRVLSELMVEAASKETLLRNMSVLPPDKLQDLHYHLYFFAILECDSDKFPDTVKDSSPSMMEALVLCLMRDNIGGFKRDDMDLIRRKVIIAFTSAMNCRDTSASKFWEVLFKVNEENLVEMWLKYNTLAEMTFDALGDRGRQIDDDEPSESCYIQLTESQLHAACNTIFKSETLKFKFLDYVQNNGYVRCIPLF